MKSILLIMPYGSVGGMERLAFTFYNYYKSMGYQVKALKIIRLDSDIIHFGTDELYLSALDFSDMTASERMMFYLKAPMHIRKQIRKFGITHSIAFGDMANTFSALTGTREFKVGSIHALKSVEFQNQAFLNKVFRFSYKSVYRFLDKVVCISEAIKTDLIQNCGFAFTGKLEVIYNPHDIAEILLKSQEEIDAAEQSLFNEQTLVFLGRLSIQKAPWHLIKAFSILKKTNSEARLLLIGDGDSNVEQYIKKLITKLELDSVIFLGRRSNPYKYLKRARAVVLSSYYEGTPNVIVEAMALGIPTVTSNCTAGIFEMMSFQKPEKVNNLLITEAGIVTPTFYKGILGLPENDQYIDQEYEYAAALQLLFSDNKFAETLAVNREALLRKFDIETIAELYLKPI